MSCLYFDAILFELHKLCFIGNDVESLPTEIIYQFGLKTLILDISFNLMRFLHYNVIRKIELSKR